jgi:hypothetical protein
VIFISEQDFNSQDVFVTLPESPFYLYINIKFLWCSTPQPFNNIAAQHTKIFPSTKHPHNKHVALERTQISM